MTLFFCTLLSEKSRVPDILKVPDPKKISGRPDKLELWVQIDSANRSEQFWKKNTIPCEKCEDLPENLEFAGLSLKTFDRIIVKIFVD